MKMGNKIFGKFLFALLGILCAAGTASGQQDRLRHHIGVLASDSLDGRKSGSDGGRRAAEYIAAEFESIGLLPGSRGRSEENMSYYQTFYRNDMQYRNVVGFIPGSDDRLADQYIVVGAHYDHLGYRGRANGRVVYHGADDNASGVAAMLETARVLKDMNLDRTVIFVAFDAEEDGLWGSEAMLRKVASDRVCCMVNLDMVGWLKDGRLDVVGVGEMSGGRQLIGTVDVPEGLEVKLVEYDRSLFTGSDHLTFIAKGIPAFNFTTGTGSPYHKPGDTADAIDYDGLEMISAYTADVVAMLADLPEIVGANASGERRRIVDGGVTASIGSMHHDYGSGTAMRGRTRFSWNIGAFMQFNIDDMWAVRLDASYNHRTARYPHTNDAGDLVVGDGFRKYASPALLVPVSAVMKLDFTNNVHFYLSFGGYYGYVIGAEVDGRSVPYYSHEGGLTGSIMLEVGHVGFGWSTFGALSRTAPSDTKIRNHTSYFTVQYRF